MTGLALARPVVGFWKSWSFLNLRTMLFFFEIKFLLVITVLSIGETRQMSMPREGDDCNFRPVRFADRATPDLMEKPLILDVWSSLYFSSSFSSISSTSIEGFSLFWMCTMGGYLYSSVSFLTHSNFFSFKNMESSFSKRYLASSCTFPLPFMEPFLCVWVYKGFQWVATVVAVFPNW